MRVPPGDSLLLTGVHEAVKNWIKTDGRHRGREEEEAEEEEEEASTGIHKKMYKIKESGGRWMNRRTVCERREV